MREKKRKTGLTIVTDCLLPYNCSHNGNNIAVMKCETGSHSASVFRWIKITFRPQRYLNINSIITNLSRILITTQRKLIKRNRT